VKRVFQQHTTGWGGACRGRKLVGRSRVNLIVAWWWRQDNGNRSNQESKFDKVL